MFQLDIHPHPELVDIERRCTPLDADLFSDPPRLFRAETHSLRHLVPPHLSTRTSPSSVEYQDQHGRVGQPFTNVTPSTQASARCRADRTALGHLCDSPVRVP